MKTSLTTALLLTTANTTQTKPSSLGPSSTTPATDNAAASLDHQQSRPLPRHVNVMGVGSSCTGSEGAWYCMSSAFQRCASGQWSDVIDCAEGTVCEPEGLTYEFQTAFGISAAAGTAAATTTTISPPSVEVTTSSEMSTTATGSSPAETICTDTSSVCSVAATKTLSETSTSATASSTGPLGAPKQDTSGASYLASNLSRVVGSLIVGSVLLSLMTV